MPRKLPLHISLLLAIALSGCAAVSTTNTNRTERHYAFGAPTHTANSAVAPIVTTARTGQAGPANVAHTVYFDFDSYTVRPADRSIIESHAQWLRNHPEQKLMLQGHTDARGGIEYNLALGQKRAESVRQSLELLGTPARRVEPVSYGKERLADQGSSEAAHQRNRRVEFSYQ